MSNDSTSIAKTDLIGARATLRTAEISGERLELGAASQVIDQRALAARATSKQREGILQSLYTFRREILRAKRAEGLPPDQLEFLQEINQQIDAWEAPEARSSGDDIWRQLEALAKSTLSVEAKLGPRR